MVFEFKLWKAKARKVLAAGGAYLSVYQPESIRMQQIRLSDYLNQKAKALEVQAADLRKQAEQVQE